jgi:nucleoside-diphosphate-sugar epimerase
MSKVIITGADGFLGGYLAGLLEERKDLEILALLRRKPDHWPVRARFLVCDLREPVSYRGILLNEKPDCIYHFAGLSVVTGKLETPQYFEGNFLTTVRLLEVLSSLPHPIKILFTSSVHVYGNLEGTVEESAEICPANPYGFTKYLAEEAMRSATQRFANLSVIVARLYNCFGPGQGRGFVCSDICHKIACLPETGQGVLSLGPISTFRRFLDVRDAVVLLEKLMNAPMPSRFEVFNVASRKETQVREIVRAVLRIAGKSARIESTEDNSHNRLFGLKVSCEKLERVLGPMHLRSLEDTLSDMYESIRKGATSCP